MEYTDEIMRDYLLGKLNKLETEQLESDIQNDPDLREALALQGDVLIGIQSGFDDQLRQKLSDSLTSEEAKVKRLPLWRWASAAAIILGSLGVYFYMSQTTLDQRLYAEYFQDFPNVIAPGQRGEGQVEPAFAAYYAERWSVAKEAFKSLQQANPTESYPSFYKALTHMHLEEWEPAILELEKVRAGDDQRFIDPATWYVALAYLRQGQSDRSRLILSAIGDGTSAYADDAKQLLEAME